MNPEGHKGHKEEGFTLMELVVVAVVLVALAAVAAPRYANASNNYHLNMAARKVAADLAMARNDAFARGLHRTVTFTTTANQYKLVGIADMNQAAQADTTVTLASSPYGVTLGTVSFGGQPSVVFDGYGMPNSGGQINLSSGSLQQTVTVDASSGNITIP